MADPIPGAPPSQTDSGPSFASKLMTAPIQPYLKLVNALMQRYPGQYSAHPPEGKDRIDRFFHLNNSLIDQPGGQRIQTPLFHPQTGALINTGLGLQPSGGSTAGGALIAPGLKPGPGISRDQFITSLKGNDPIKITPAVRAFLDAIERSSFGVPSDKGPLTPEVGALLDKIGSPLTRQGNNLIHEGTAFPPMQQAMYADAPMLTHFARWLSHLPGARQSASGMSTGTHYPLTADELGEIFDAQSKDPAARAALIKMLRSGLLPSDKQGTENN